MTSLERRARFEYLSDGPPEAGSARFAWRLLAGNNRPLGRAASVSATFTEARDDAQALHVRVHEAEPRFAQSPAPDAWTWRLLLDGVAIAAGVRPYLRRIECVRSYSQFLTSVALADPLRGALRYFGPASLRSYPNETAPEPVAL